MPETPEWMQADVVDPFDTARLHLEADRAAHLLLRCAERLGKDDVWGAAALLTYAQSIIKELDESLEYAQRDEAHKRWKATRE